MNHNHKRWLFLVSLVWMAGQTAHAVEGTASLAILTDVHGTVQIQRAGKTVAGRSGAKLVAGDVVLAADGSATVFYNGRPPVVLKKGQQAKVAATTTVASAGAWRNAYDSIASGFDRRAEEIPGAVLRDASVTMVFPINSRVLAARPTFRWIPFKQSGYELTDYLVTLTDASGEKLIWQASTKGTTLEYPETAPTLETGQKYKWYVMPRQMGVGGTAESDEDKRSRSAWFEVPVAGDASAAQAEVAQFAADAKDLPPGMLRTMQAAALAKRGFHADAIALLTPDATQGVTDQASYQAKVVATLPALDDSSRALLRSLYLDTKQKDLVQKLDAVAPVPASPDAVAAPGSGQVRIQIVPDER